MTDQAQSKPTCAATVFHVQGIKAAFTYYTEKLGFQEEFRVGEPTFHAGICCGGVVMHLNASQHFLDWVGKGNTYVFHPDVDAYHEELVGKGAIVLTAPADQAYGMRDFRVEDPEGNSLSFGMAAAVAEGP